MTIAATPRRSPVYTGNGVATTYAFAFKVLDATTLVVTVADENDLNSQVLVNGVDYTVTLNADQDASPGGEISYAGLPVGHRLVITSDTDSSQPTAISNLGAFHANVLEGALDRIVILHQQQQEQLDRCVKAPVTSEQDPTTLLDNAVTSASNYATAAAASAAAAALIPGPSGSANVGFLQSGAGAVARTALAKMREAVSVADFGAVGDGVTDDRAAIQAALDAAGDGQRVYFPGAGPYLVGATGLLVTGKSGLELTGRATIKFGGVSANSAYTLGPVGLLFDACTRSGVSGLRFDGNAQGQGAVGFKNCTDCFIDACEVYACATTDGQIVSAGSTRTRISNNTVRDSTGATRGIWIGNLSALEMDADCLISGNRVYGNDATGIVVTSVGGAVSDNYSCDNNGSGINFPGANGYSAKRITCTGNTCNGNAFHGFQSDVAYTSDADLSQDIVIAGNVCNGNDGSGIYTVNCRGWTISGNTCTDNNADATASASGIQADDRSYDLCITGNYCYDTRSGASRTQDTGIRIRGQAASPKNIVIVGNLCRNHIYYGIEAQTSGAGLTVHNLTIVGNNCLDNSSRGIFLAEFDPGAISAVIQGNSCLGNATADLRVSILDAVIGVNRYSTEHDAAFRDFAALDTTPSVKSRKLWRANNASPTTITAFDDGVNAQEIVIFFANGNTTLTHGDTLLLKGGISVTAPSDSHMSLILRSGVWREVSRSF